jgi:hypothetical protein
MIIIILSIIIIIIYFLTWFFFSYTKKEMGKSLGIIFGVFWEWHHEHP